MAIEGKPRVDYSGGASPGAYPRSAIKQPTRAPFGTRRFGRPALYRARGAFVCAKKNGCGYWLRLFDAITVTGLSR